MKDKLSVIHADESSTRVQTPRNPVDAMASWARRASRFQLTHSPLQYGWQVHGSVRSFHQAPHSTHIARTRKGG